MIKSFSPYSLAAAVLLAFPAVPLQAQNTWRAGTAPFDVAGNWTDNSVPTSGTFALISNGGTATMGTGVSATVRNLLLGRGTGGNLLINGGYLKTIWTGTLGQNFGGVGVGTVTVSNGGVWDAGGAGLPGGFPAEIEIGSGGAAGNLNIITDGTVNANAIKVGESGGGLGTLKISGGTLNNFETSGSIMWVGYENSGVYQQTGGTSIQRQVTVGSASGVTGTATVSGGTMTSVIMILGDQGTGTFTQTGGLVSNSNYVNFGLQGGTGTLDLQGGVFETANFEELSGSGRVKLNGGTLRALSDQSDFFKGFETGDVTVEAGGGFIDTNGHSISINNSLSGAGRLTKLGAGTLTVTTGTYYLGGTTVENGTLVVSGADASINNGSMTVGESSGGNAALEINGGKVTSVTSVIANQSGSTGLVTMNGGQWIDGNTIMVGGSGNGTLQITDGLVSASSSLTIGNLSTGKVTVDSGTLQTINFTVGNGGNGTLVVNGGVVRGLSNTASQIRIGEQTGSTGSVTVNGGTVTTDSNMAVGVAGTGTLVINDGAVSNAAGVLGLSTGGRGTATVNGGSWTLSDTLTVGAQGQGTLTVNGGLVSAAGATTVAAALTSGTISLTNASGAAGVLETKSITEGIGTGRVNFDGGILRAVANESNFLSGFETGDVTSLAGGATVDSNGFDIGVASPIGGVGGLTKTGLGTLTMTGTSTYQGATTVQTGKLTFNGINSGNSAVTVQSGAELGGTGNFSGAVTVANGATLAPGDGAGTLTVGSMILNNTSNLQFELGTTSDRVVAVNGLTLDGNLNVTALGGFGTGSYTLFQYGGVLTNNGLNLASVPTGRYYEVDLSQNGFVNLLVLDAEYWDGSNTTPDGVVNGGSGTWNNSTTNWTTVTGNTNFPWSGTKIAIFTGTAGVVNVADTISVADIAFETDGYSLTGPGTLAINGPRLKVNTDNVNAQIGTQITGAGGLVKAGAGTLTLTGINTYAGDTSIQEGTLALAGSGLIATSGVVDISSGAVFDIAALGATTLSVGNITGTGNVNLGSKSLSIGSGGDATFGGVVYGSGGSIVKTGIGTVTFTGANTYVNGTTIQNGTLALAGGGSLLSTGGLNIQNSSSFDISGITAAGTTIGDLLGTGNVVLGSKNLNFGAAGTTTFSGIISGAGGIAKYGTGTETLAGTNTYGGGTTLNAGILSVGSNANLGASNGALTFDGGSLETSGTFTMNRATTLNAGGGTFNTDTTTTLTQQGAIGGTGILTKTGAGTLTLAGVNNYGGGTSLQAGQINIGNNDALGTGTLTVAAGTVLATDGSARTIANNMVVNGDFSIYPKGTLLNVSAFTLNGNMDLAGGDRTITNPSDFSGGDFGEVRLGGVISNGGLTLNTIPGSFAFFKMNGAGSNTYAGSTDLQTGISLQLDKSGGATAIAGNLFIEDDAVAVVQQSEQIADNSIVTINGIGRLQLGTLSDVTETIGSLLGDGEVDLSDNTTGSKLSVASGNFSGIISGGLAAGTSLEKIDLGQLSLSGASTYAGATKVTAGSLAVNNTTGSATGTGAVTVGSGALLGGAGSITGVVTVQSGGTLAPGNGPGTLTLGELFLDTGSHAAFQLAAPSGTAGVDSDLINVATNLNGSTSSGNLNIQSGSFFDLSTGSGFAAGTYRLFNYGGALSGNPAQVFFSGAQAGYTLQLNTATAGQVNLVVGYDGLQFWNDSQTAPDGTVHGGNGTWNNSSSNWTNQAGNASNSWDGLTAVFAGTAGTVTVADTINVAGLQFGTTGYTLADGGGSLSIGAASTEMRLDAGVNTSIAVGISGTGGLMKTGDGQLTLSGTNSYSGGTMFNSGILSVAQDNNLGASTGSMTFNGGTLETTGTFTTSRATTLNAGGGTFNTDTATTLTQQGVVGGAGALTKTGAGALVLTGANSYSGGTSLNAGTLTVSQDNNLGASSGGLVFNGGTLETTGTFTMNRGTILNGSGTFSTDAATVLTEQGSISGTGALSKTGAGTLILTGANTYSGGSTISAGNLQIGNGGESGSITGNILNNAALIFDRTGNLTYGGVMSGTGSLTKISGGILTLAGSNSYTGGTSLNGGVIAISSDANLGDASGALTFDGGALSINGASTVNRATTLNAGGGTISANGVLATLSGVISGGGSLTTNGTAALILSGINTYTGGTILNPGILSVAQNNNLGSSAGNLTFNGGTLQTTGSFTMNRGTTLNGGGGTFNTDAATTLTQQGVIGGEGTLTKAGAGTLVLTGTNSYGGDTVINEGTLALTGTGSLPSGGTTNISSGATFDIAGIAASSTTIGEIAGGGAVALGNKTLSLNADENTIFSGAISGTGGNVAKAGPGILTMTGNSSYSGLTSVTGGGLVVNGSLNSSELAVGNGAFLGGSGRIAGEVVIQNGGTLSPGNSPGIITLGSLKLQSGSTTQIQIDGPAAGSQYDQVQVAGNADLNGTLSLLFGYVPVNGQLFTLIEAGSFTLSGDPATGFSAITSNVGSALGFYTTVNPNTFTLTITVRQGSFVPFGGTPNERSVAGGLDRLFAIQGTTALISQLDTLNAAELQDALSQLSPDELAAMGRVVFQQFQGQFNTFNNRFTELRNGGPSISVAGIHILDPSGSMELNPQTMLADTGLENIQGLTLLHAEPVLAENRWGIYLAGTGTFTDIDGDGNADGYDFSSGGMTMGVDYRLTDNLIVGFQSGYANTDVNFGGSGGDMDSNGANWAMTGGWMGNQGTYVHGMLGGNYNSFDTERNVLGQKAVGSTEGIGFNTALVLGHEFGFGKDKAFKTGPEVAMKYSWLNVGGYTESGALGALKIQEQTPDSLRSRLGWRMSYNGVLGKVKLLPFAYVGWEHEYLDSAQSIAAAFPGSPATGFTVQGVAVASDSAVMGLGITAGLTETISAKLSYDNEVSSDLLSQSINGALRFEF